MTLLLVTLAVARLTRLVARDDFPLIRWARDRILSRWPAEDAIFTDEWVDTVNQTTRHGAPVVAYGDSWAPVEPHWAGDLVTCVWCASVWVATVATVALWATGVVTLPWPGWVALPLAQSMIAGLLASWE